MQEAPSTQAKALVGTEHLSIFGMALNNFLKISLLFHATIRSDEGFTIIFIK